MDRYVELQVLPDPEFNAPLLMGALFSKLHRGLVRLGGGAVGVSFPDIKPGHAPVLGARLRLHGREDRLAKLMSLDWMTGVQDHVTVSDIAEVPEKIQYRSFYRVQSKSSVDRLRRRRMQRHGEDEETARRLIPESAGERLELPFVFLTSQSSGQRFPLFIGVGPPRDTALNGVFSAYGLSRNATIPWF